MAFISEDIKKKKGLEDEEIMIEEGAAPAPAAEGQTIETQKPTPQSTGFVNLQKYLQASRPERIGESLVGKGKELEKRYEESIGEGKAEALSSIKDAPEAYSSEDLSKIGGDPKAFDKLKGILGQKASEVPEMSETAGFGRAAQTGEQLEAFLGGLEDDSTYAGALQQIAGPGYSRGQTALDTALLAASPEAKQQISQFGEEWQQKAPALRAQAEQEIMGKAEQERKELEDLQTQLRGDISTARQTQEASIQQAVAAERAARESALQNLISQRAIPTQEQLRGLAKQKLTEQGLVPTTEDVALTQTLDPMAFGSIAEVDYTDVITPEQQARAQALASLVGETSRFTGQLGADPEKVAFDEAAYQAKRQEIIDDLASRMKGVAPTPQIERVLTAGQGGLETPDVTIPSTLTPEPVTINQEVAPTPAGSAPSMDLPTGIDPTIATTQPFGAPLPTAPTPAPGQGMPVEAKQEMVWDRALNRQVPTGRWYVDTPFGKHYIKS